MFRNDKRYKSIIRASVVVILGHYYCTTGWGMTFGGVIASELSDPNASGVADVTVLAHGIESAAAFETTTDTQGRWSFVDVPEDFYEVYFSKEGYAFYFYVDLDGILNGFLDFNYYPVYSDEMGIVTVAVSESLQECVLTVEVVGGHGQVYPTGGSYPAGMRVLLFADAESGYQLKSWTGTDDDSSTPWMNTVTMDGDAHVQVEFEALPLQGEGTPESPYLIEWPHQALAIADDPGAHYRLTYDLDLDPCLPGGRVFDGALVPLFSGTLDGGGYCIQRLTISGGSIAGLFGEIAKEARVYDLALLDANVTGTGGTDVNPGGTGHERTAENAGALAAINSGDVVRCYSTGAVSGYGSVGGLVGWNAGVVSMSHNTASVSGNQTGGGFAGGLIGANAGQVSNCYSSGRVSSGGIAGGLAGLNAGKIDKCYSSGIVSANVVGGLTGVSVEGDVTGSFWDMESSGQTQSAGGRGLTTDQMQEVDIYLDAGWDWRDEILNGTEGIWEIASDGGYPTLSLHPDILGYLQFEGDRSDSAGQTDPIALTNAPIINNALYLTGIYEYKGLGGLNTSWSIRELNKDSFSFVLQFYPLEEGSGSNIFTGGHSYRWISLRTKYSSGELQLTLNNHRICHTFSGWTVSKCNWHTAIVAVDVPAGMIRVLFDGKSSQTVPLPPDFSWNTASKGRADFSFADYSYGGTFYGYADNLVLYRYALTDREMSHLANTQTFSTTVPYIAPEIQACADPDMDGDGLTDRQEDQFGTHPFRDDTDTDGLSDWEELMVHDTDPLWADSDGDGLLDLQEVLHGTDPHKPDSDGDCLWDGFEVAYGYAPLEFNDSALDTDVDGISNLDEQRFGTDPRNPDSDGDGVSDGDEVRAGTDPTTPTASLPIAYYQFENSPRDSMGISPDFDLKNTYYEDGSLYLNGTYASGGHYGYTATARPKDLSIDSFSICFDFYRLPSDYWSNRVILDMRPWFEVRYSSESDVLWLTLQSKESDRLHLRVTECEECHWNNIIFSADLIKKQIVIYFNGELVQVATLPNWFKPDTQYWRNSMTFLDYASGAAFYGYVDNFLVFNDSISPWLAYQIGTGVAQIGGIPYLPPIAKECVHPDSDGDGLTDYEEFTVCNTDPNNEDTDGGGTIDSIEIANGTDPLDPSDD